MDCNEDLSIDALADLIDDDDDIASFMLDDETLNMINKEQNNDIKQSNSNNEEKKLKPIDLFARETNIETSKPIVLDKNSLIHSGDTEDEDEETKTYLTESGNMIKKRIAPKPSYESKRVFKKAKTWRDTESTLPKKDYIVEEYSGIRIINPLVPHDFMKNKMVGRRVIKMSFIHNLMKKNQIEGDWVTIGVVVNKLPSKVSKNGKTYSIWKLNDLHDTDKLVSFFLFSNVHAQHWKTSVGSVIALLNPSFYNDGNKASGVSLNIDNPGKLLLIGTSKDFSLCHGRRKDGTPCTSVVNKSVCEFCSFHVSKEYKKMSNKRVELQATYSGPQVNLKSKILKGQNVMYGGQMFSSPSNNVVGKPAKSKDKLTLHNLKFKKKIQELSKEEEERLMNTVEEVPVKKTIFSDPSKFINHQLSIPSIGSRNFSQHLSQTEVTKDGSLKKKEFVSISPKQLLKLHEQKLKQMVTTSGCNLNVSPQLGRGLKPGDKINLNSNSFHSKKIYSTQDVAKLKAIQTIKENGPIVKKNPNAVKASKSPESMAKIKETLEKNTASDIAPIKEQSETKTNLLGTVDINSEKFQSILNRKSSHHFEVEMEELERVENYFRDMEKKEKLEQKMTTFTEITCDAVSCQKCKYTAHSASDLCKNEGHPLRTHKAVKRFFSCTSCNRRTCTFAKFPTKACKNCGEYNFEKTSMMKPRSGPKLENEVLNIRGDEVKFLNSLVH